MHPKNFGSDKIGRTYVPPLHVSLGEILHFKKLARFRGKSHGHPKRDKNSKEAKSFFRLDFNVYIDEDNREIA